METLDKQKVSERIAKNVAALFNDTEETLVMNLGVGIPNMVSNYLDNPNIFVQGENGMLGVGALAGEDEVLPNLINSGRQPIKETPGCMYFDSAYAFGMIRGGHVDVAVIGAFEVDEQGDVANWIIPGGKMLGVGGAMDLVSGARTLVISMRHTGREGDSKLLKKCTLPLTAMGAVNFVVTEWAIFEYTESGIVLRKIGPGITAEELRSITEFDYSQPEEIALMLD